MKTWLIRGKQQDGEHEHRIFSFMTSENEPTYDEMQVCLLRGHIYGLTEKEDEMLVAMTNKDGWDQDDYNGFNLGDRTTSVTATVHVLVEPEHIPVLERYGFY